MVALVGSDPGRLALHLGNPVPSLAMRAYRTAIPDAAFHKFVSFGLVMEVFSAQNRHDRLLSAWNIGQIFGYVKYNIASPKAYIGFTNPGTFSTSESTEAAS